MERIAPIWLPTVPTDRYLYHYTGAETAVTKILTSGMLRLSLLCKTSDPRENRRWLITAESDPGQQDPEFGGHAFRRAYEEFNSRARTTTKILCLTRDDEKAANEDEGWSRGFGHPRMWSQYAENHRGVCFVLNADALRSTLAEELGDDGLLHGASVTYSNDAFFRPNLNLTGATADMVTEQVMEMVAANLGPLFFTKTLDWAQECEFRWILWTDDAEVRFIPIKAALHSIILGADFDASSWASVNDLAGELEVPLARMRWFSHGPRPLYDDAYVQYGDDDRGT